MSNQINQVELDAAQIKEVLSYLIQNNKNIQAQGKTPVATEIIGESGLGKTSITLQLAKELNMHHVKLNLAQIEEIGDLVGFPMRQFQMQLGGKLIQAAQPKAPEFITKVVIEDGKKVLKKVPVENATSAEPVKQAATGQPIWVDEVAVDQYIKQGYIFTGQKRMSYCPPEWIADKQGGGFLILDDWNRADIRFIQAVMELVDRQEYISWKLPKDWHILLTANPDDGKYLVNAIDIAQKTRFMSIMMKWDADRWAEWAEQNEIDNRCINFMLMNREVVKDAVNPRSLTNFFNSITSIENFDNSLSLIQNLGEGSVGPEVAILFTNFIHNKMDRWITPKQILLDKDTTTVLDAMRDIFGTGNDYRADIASVITTRIVNFALHYAESNPISEEIIDRLISIIKADEVLTDDLNYHLAKKLLAGNKQKFKAIAYDNDIQEIVTR